MTIVEAAIEVLKTSGQAMTVAEVYEQIIVNDLYSFNSDHPIHILDVQMKRRTAGLELKSAGKKKFFQIVDGNKFELLGKEETEAQENLFDEGKGKLYHLWDLHEQYQADFKEKVLGKLLNLSPTTFEVFGQKLLEAYGFDDMEVTQISQDGGIDGFGKLKVGLAHMNVAFQCKRWKGSIGRPEIDRFRGAIQGEYEQGIFFTTSTFTKQAQEASIKKGAVPVILIDGKQIVDMMIAKEFGVQVEYMKVYEYALDKEL